jgi:hypothetical protein
MGAVATNMGPTTGYCRNCGKALTAETSRDVQGVFYCGDCLAKLVTHAQPAQNAGGPALAALLGFIPGLGAVYNGDYAKGVMHVVIFGTIISLIDRAPGLFVPLLVAFIFYMPFEAYQTAKARLKDPQAAAGAASQTPVGPILLIGLGIVFLLDKFHWIDFDRVVDTLWPLGLIGFGVWWLVKCRRAPAE